MLKALETGMGEGKWFRLIDKVWSEKNLQSALEQVVYNGGSAGVDGRSVAAVRRQSEEEIAIQEFANANGLTLHPEKTQIVDASQPGGFDFLGYHFERGMKWPRKKSLTKLKEVLRAKTRRTEGRSIKAICEDLNGLLHGWFEYFKHSKSNVFTTIDGYTRGRLRSILRKRRRGRGRGRGRDHKRWSNDFFHAQGLISLSQCLRAIRQSP